MASLYRYEGDFEKLTVENADLRRQLAAKQAEIDDALAVIEGPSTIKEALSIFHTEHVLLHEAREQLAAANERADYNGAQWSLSAEAIIVFNEHTSMAVAMALRKAAVAALYWCEAADENKIENAILSISVGDTLEKLGKLEKDASRLDWLLTECCYTIGHALEWPVYPQDPIAFRAAIDASAGKNA